MTAGLDAVSRRVGGRWGLLAILVVLVALSVPIAVGAIYVDLAVRILILAIFGIAFNLAFGFTDMPSFGHAAFYGLGAYGLAMMLTNWTPDSLAIPLAVGLVAAVIYGLFVALFSTQGRGIYFALLTFAFAQLLYEVVARWTELTGGSEGMFLSIPSVFGFNLWDTTVIYYVSLAMLVVVAIAGYRLIQSPFGNVMRAVRYNEERARAIGYPVRRVKITVFVISAGLSAVAGILHAINNQFVSPDMMFFQTSIDVLVVAILGGPAHFVGPIVGAAILVILHEIARSFTDVGIVVTGLLFVFIIIFLPEGVVGFIRRRL